MKPYVFFFCASLLILFASTTLAAQQLVGTTGAFHSGSKTVAIERFDPPAKGTHRAILLVHGGGGPQGEWRSGGILQGLVQAGYSVFVPHYFDGEGGAWTRSPNPDQFFAYVRTLNDATRYMAQQPDVESKKIGLVGLSLGGYLVLGLAEETNSHPPPLHSPEIAGVVEFFGGMPQFAIPRMTTMPPVLILHGEDDDVVPVSMAYDLEKLLRSKGVNYEMKIYPHQGHGFSGDALEDADKRMVSFLLAHVK